MASAESKNKIETRELTRQLPGAGEDPAAGISWRVGASIATIKEMRRDPQIRLGLELVKAPIYGAEWAVECERDDIAEYVDAEMRAIWRSFARSSLAAVEFGFAPHEKLWAVDAKGVHLRQVKDLDPQESVILKDQEGQFAGVRWKGRVVVPAEKCFLFTHWKEFGNLYGRSRLEASQEHWLEGNNTRKLMHRYLKRRAVPPIVGHAPAEKRHNASGAEVDTMDEMEKNLRAVESGSAVALPSELDEKGNDLWRIELLKDEQRGVDFLKVIDYHDTMKMRGIIVPERVGTQGGGGPGTYSMVDAQIGMFLTLEDLLLFDLLDHANRYILPQLVAFNFGPDAPKAAMTSKGLDREKKDLLRAIAEKLIAGAATAELVKETADVVAVLEGAGLPVVDEEERKRRAEESRARAAQRPFGMRRVDAPDDDPRIAYWVNNHPVDMHGRRVYVELAAGAGDERDAIIARAESEAVDYFDALIGRVKKNSVTGTDSKTSCSCSTN